MILIILCHSNPSTVILTDKDEDDKDDKADKEEDGDKDEE